MTTPSINVAALYRYPVKGLSPQREQRLEVSVDAGLANDRRFALALGTTVFDSEHPHPLDKGHFLMLRRNEALAAFSTHFDETAQTLSIDAPGDRPLVMDLTTDAGRRAIASFFDAYVGEATQGGARLVEAAGHKFTDVSHVSPALMKAVSLINLASVRDFSEKFGCPIDPLRFRANVYVDGLPAWEELRWLERHVTIGSASFRCRRLTRRCAAIEVDPATGCRDLKLTRALVDLYGHPNCGVYLEVIGDGDFGLGAPLVLGPEETSSPH